MQHHRPVFFAIGTDVEGIKAFRQVEVGLQRSALPFTPDCITQHIVELRTVKRPVARLILEALPGRLTGFAQGLFSLVPDFIRTDPFFRAVGKADQHLIEPEVLVDRQDQVVDRDRLLLQLLFGAEDMGVVLGKATHAEQSVQGTGRFIAVHLAEFGNPHRQVAVALQTVLEKLNMARTVHRLQRENPLILCLRDEHVLVIFVPVAGGFPQEPCRAVAEY